jgi:predicted metal-dependent HD superfamily phosphohydrolase
MNTKEIAINNISRSYILALKNFGFKLNDNNKNNFMKIFENVINRYSEPHRFFHTIEHISAVLKNLKTSQPEAILAAIYHDIIYVPGSDQNEYCSAQLSANHLSMLGIKSVLIMKVSRHILSTEQHVPIDLPGNEELLDSDMMILAASKPVFNEYCHNIRLEFPHLSNSEFESQRSRWALEQLGRKKIFHSKKNIRAEKIARINLRTLTKI